MPSIFKKKEAPKAAAPALDINEVISKLNRQINTAREQEGKAHEAAKNAIRANNQTMAKTYMNQSKMASQQIKNLTGQLNMLQMKQNQMTTIDMAKAQVALMKQVNTEMGDTDQVMDELQDTLAESAEQQQQTLRMNEMMNQFSDMAMGMMDQDGEVDQDLAQLQAELDMEKMAGVAAPLPVQQVPAEQAKPVVKAENNLDDLL